jgi:putative membrane protein
VTVQWWCAARGVPWTWDWQAYPGIWLFVAAVGALGVGRLVASRESPAHALARCLGFGAGLVVLWAALDWPLGPLGAGYLLAAHTLQYVAVTGVAAPLLLAGVRPALAAGDVSAALGRSPFAWLARPLGAALVFNAVLIVTHVPGVVDRLLMTPLGTFTVDLAWLGSGLLFWWPVIGAPSGSGHLAGPAGLLYLFLGGIPSHGVGALLTLATYPLYGLYELAPRVGDITARADQQLAGVIMWVGAPVVGLVAMSILFFRWARSESDDPLVLPTQGSVDAPYRGAADNSPQVRTV